MQLTGNSTVDKT